MLSVGAGARQHVAVARLAASVASREARRRFGRRQRTGALATGHAFGQNIRRGHYEIATDRPAQRRLPEAFDELVLAI